MAVADNPTDDLTLLGAIAAAPGGYNYAQIAQYVADNPIIPIEVSAFLPIVLLGAQAADRRLDVYTLTSPAMQALLDSAQSRCLDELRHKLTVPPTPVFKEHANLTPLLDYLDAQAINHLQPKVPVLFIQGDSDTLVKAQEIQHYYQALQKQGKTVFYQAIDKGNHRDALQQSAVLSQDFISRFSQAIPSKKPN